MEIQLQELIDQIKKEGVEKAEAEAKTIVDAAKDQAERIVAQAQSQADQILQTARAEQARITAWSPNNWESLFQISKGSLTGIEAGDAVITEYGAFVGQVTEVGTSSATVRTVIDVNTSVGVLVGADGSAAMLAGDYALMGEGLVSVTWLTEGAQLFLDDEILTSGSGGLIPSGLVVGTVSSIQTEAAGQTEYGIIAPAADLDSLVQVFVIKDFGETAAQETQPVETPAASPSPSPSAEPTAPVTGG